MDICDTAHITEKNMKKDVQRDSLPPNELAVLCAYNTCEFINFWHYEAFTGHEALASLILASSGNTLIFFCL